MYITREDFEETALPFISEKDSLSYELLEKFEISDEPFRMKCCSVIYTARVVACEVFLNGFFLYRVSVFT